MPGVEIHPRTATPNVAALEAHLRESAERWMLPITAGGYSDGEDSEGDSQSGSELVFSGGSEADMSEAESADWTKI